MNSCGSRCVRHRWYSAGSTLRWARSPVAPNSTKVAGSGTRSSRRPSRSGFAAAFAAAARFLPSFASRTWRIVRGASFFAGGAGCVGLSGAAGRVVVLVAADGRVVVMTVDPSSRMLPLLGLHLVAAELVAQRREDLAAV